MGNGLVNNGAINLIAIMYGPSEEALITAIEGG